MFLQILLIEKKQAGPLAQLSHLNWPQCVVGHCLFWPPHTPPTLFYSAGMFVWRDRHIQCHSKPICLKGGRVIDPSNAISEWMLAECTPLIGIYIHTLLLCLNSGSASFEGFPGCVTRCDNLYHAMSPFSLFLSSLSVAQRILGYVRPRRVVAVHPPKRGKRRPHLWVAFWGGATGVRAPVNLGNDPCGSPDRESASTIQWQIVLQWFHTEGKSGNKVSQQFTTQLKMLKL